MSYVMLVQITCDTAGCTAARWADSAQVAWREAHADGWTRVAAGHRCPSHRLVAPVVEQIRALAAEGLPDSRIGERLGLTRSNVQHLRNKHGIAGQRPGRPSSGVPA